MKKFMLGAVGVFGLAGSAVAADQAAPFYAKAPAIAAAAYNWTGFYAGVHASYGFGSTEWFSLNIPSDGALGGVQAGYNQQIGNLLIGVEGDFSFATIRGGRTLDFLGQGTQSQSSRTDRLSTVTGRAGFANGRWLTYTKAGVAWGHQAHDYNVNIFGPPAQSVILSGQENRAGLVVGAGVEYALANNWSLRGEYDYIRFRAHDFDFNGVNSATGPVSSTVSTTQDLHLIKVGANYQFGAPQAAKAIAPVHYANAGFDWTGLYLGAQAGYGSGDTNWRDLEPFGKFIRTGGFGGGQAGANVQLGVIVLGVEAELVGGNIGGATHINISPITVDAATGMNWLAMATARIGMVSNERWLTYVKGGIAASHDRHTLAESTVGASFDLGGSRISTGYVLGAGVEYAFASNWSAKFEYNYIDFGNDNTTMTGAVSAPGMSGGYFFPTHVAQTVQLGKIGVNYHFAP